MCEDGESHPTLVLWVGYRSGITLCAADVHICRDARAISPTAKQV